MRQKRRQDREGIRTADAIDGQVGVSAIRTAGADLTKAVQALTEAALSLRASAGEIARAAVASHRVTSVGTPGDVAPAIDVWEDDPLSETPGTGRASPVTVSPSAIRHPLLQAKIRGDVPVPTRYPVGSAQFRYWAAAESIARAANFWGPLLPQGTRWTTVDVPMPVTLEAGTALNANYSRAFGLRFYQQTVQFVSVFSGESPDVVTHEFGHAILDAVRPELFNTASIEVAAFHESFGDMSSILSALQLESMRRGVIAETGGRVNTNSRLSRLAEQLGWAIRQLKPANAEPDCLRNAANQFFYRDPVQLPPTAPATTLSSEPHSFSRVFTGAFLDALGRMLLAAGEPSEGNLLTVSRDLGQLLIDAVRLAPVAFAYFTHVAANMVQADQARFGGRYRAAISSAFVHHGILSTDSAVTLASAPKPQIVPPTTAAAPAAGAYPEGAMLSYGGADASGHLSGAADAPELPTRSVSTRFGLTIEAHVAAEPPRLSVQPATFGLTRSADRGSVQPATPTPEELAAAFIEDLIQTGRIDLTQAAASGTVTDMLAITRTRPDDRVTHRLVSIPGGKLRLQRVYFDCAFCGPYK